MTSQYGVHLIGGEMIEWSEDPAARTGGTALENLILAAVPADGHVLVAGPHRDELVERLLARSRRVTCLLRSLPDAQELGRRHADSGRLTVLCGGLGKFGGTGPYDAVVAAGGLARLATPDSSAPTWTEGLAKLTAELAPEGTLVIGLENELGLHRLVDPEPADLTGGDEHWFPAHGTDRTVPTGPAELAAALTGGDPSAVRCFAGYPDLTAPTLLVAVEELAGGDDAEATAVLMAAAMGEGGGRALLADPRALARRSFARGLGASLAPSWVAVYRPAAQPPAALTGDGGHGHWATSCALRVTPGGWEREVLGEAGPRTAGRLLREPSRLAGPVPRGRLLEEVMAGLCASARLPELRALLRAYADWLEGQRAETAVFATPDNVMVDGDAFAALDPSWEMAEPVPFPTTLARGLWRFTARLLGGGRRHPWPSVLDRDGIALTLLAMSGRPADRALLGLAVALEAEIAAGTRGLSAADQVRLLAELQSGELREPLGHREALLERRRLGEELTAAVERARWSDARLRTTEKELEKARTRLEAQRAQLKKLRAELRRLRASTTFRVGRAVTAPPRLARRGLRWK